MEQFREPREDIDTVFEDIYIDGLYTLRVRRDRTTDDNAAGILEIHNNRRLMIETSWGVYFSHITDDGPEPTEEEKNEWREGAKKYIDGNIE